MEKTKKCESCGKDFTYYFNETGNYPDKRKYCDSCSAEKKASWEAKKNQPLDNFKPQIVAEEPKDIVYHPEAPNKDKSIIAQCLTKCWCNSAPVDMDKQSVLEAYKYFLSEL